MVRGFRSVPGVQDRTVLLWYETDENRFTTLCEVLGKDSAIKLSTCRPPTRILSEASPQEPLVLTVGLEDDHLRVTSLAPSSAAVVPVNQTALPMDKLARLSEGGGPDKRSTPDLESLKGRGMELATYLFGDQASSILSKCRGVRLMVVHDAPASRVPFEMLMVSITSRISWL